MEHRLAFAFSGLSQRAFNKLVRDVDEYVGERLGDIKGDLEYEVYCGPGGPSGWRATEVDVRLAGIQAERSKSVR